MKNKFFFKKIIFILVIFLSSNNFYNIALTVEPNEILLDKKQELKARKISKSIRCLVCQNQSIDDSSSLLAKDLRLLIRKKIVDGYNEREIYKFLVDRYGDFILLKPPFKLSTYALWFMPFIFLTIGIFVAFNHNKKSKKN